jgi:hypothetical protein
MHVAADPTRLGQKLSRDNSSPRSIDDFIISIGLCNERAMKPGRDGRITLREISE